MQARVINEGRNINPHRRLDILRWMQNEQKQNPRVFKDTTAKVICKRYSLCHTDVKFGTVCAIFTKMVQNNLINKHKTSGHRATFRINYLNPNLPADFVKNAPADDKDLVRSTMERVRELTDEGKKPRIEDNGAIAYKEPKPATPKLNDKLDVVVSDKPNGITYPTHEEMFGAPVAIKQDGSKVSITITLNLNFNGGE